MFVLENFIGSNNGKNSKNIGWSIQHWFSFDHLVQDDHLVIFTQIYFLNKFVLDATEFKDFL